MLAFVAGIEKTVGMRGTPDPQLAMLTTLSTEELIPVDHPIRRIRVVVDAVLAELDDTFDAMYASSVCAISESWDRRSTKTGFGGVELFLLTSH